MPASNKDFTSVITFFKLTSELFASVRCETLRTLGLVAVEALKDVFTFH